VPIGNEYTNAENSWQLAKQFLVGYYYYTLLKILKPTAPHLLSKKPLLNASVRVYG